MPPFHKILIIYNKYIYMYTMKQSFYSKPNKKINDKTTMNIQEYYVSRTCFVFKIKYYFLL